MEIPIWALSVLGFVALVVTGVVSYFLSKSLTRVDDTQIELSETKHELSLIRQDVDHLKENNHNELKNFSGLLSDIKKILQEHAVSLNHIDKNNAVTAEALKRMMNLEDEFKDLSKKSQEMEVKLEVLMSK